MWYFIIRLILVKESTTYSMKSKTPYFILLIAAILYNIWLIGKAEDEKRKEKSKPEISVSKSNQTQP
ncbi:hypothetical protein [Aquiflexum gelatinilyticum]|uniref:hypothetical protein n=1 Tax=Aquiflexum gelatinilyticum TaxID=2961943 RepID=UPI0021697BAA|nr:hypothetical protein [Aquiflexum gelatinilyticum]MCS4432816.1 hypothetical protein [Aquiflexum gelatinilyticum]